MKESHHSGGKTLRAGQMIQNKCHKIINLRVFVMSNILEISKEHKMSKTV